MQEQLISFETAKLAKEKGFNIECINTYPYKDKGIFQPSTEQNTYNTPIQYYFN